MHVPAAPATTVRTPAAAPRAGRRGGSLDRDRLAEFPAAPALLVVRVADAPVPPAPPGWRLEFLDVKPADGEMADRAGTAAELDRIDGAWERAADWIERGAGRIGVRRRGMRRLSGLVRDAGVLSQSGAGPWRAVVRQPLVARIEAAIESVDPTAVSIAEGTPPEIALATARAARRHGIRFGPRPELALAAAAIGDRTRAHLADRTSVSAAYGAGGLLRELGVDDLLPGFWMHGWTPSWHQVHPLFVAQHKRMAWTLRGRQVCSRADRIDRDAPQWVATEGQRDYLREHGYTRVEAIGLPVVYDAALADVSVPRDEGLLVAMPAHNQPGRIAGDAVTQGFLDTVLEAARDFDRVLLCVSADDFAAKRWWPVFAGAGIDVIVGASGGERHSLRRMRTLMSLAGTVMSNGFGSHLAYAAWCGARVCVHGPWADAPRAAIVASHRCLVRPELAEVQQRLLSEAALREAEPWLFAAPRDARAAPEWGAREVGEPARRSAAELRQLIDACRSNQPRTRP